MLSGVQLSTPALTNHHLAALRGFFIFDRVKKCGVTPPILPKKLGFSEPLGSLLIRDSVMVAGFVQRTHRFIIQHQMIQPKETVLVGVSGGSDSLALLYVLHKLRPQLDCQLHVAHLDHGFREDSAGDAVYVTEQAGQLGIPISSTRIDVPQLMRVQNAPLKW